MTAQVKPTNERLVAIDFIRGVAVFFLAVVHTLWMYADIATQGESWLGHAVHFLGKCTCAFLMCMGISMAFSRRRSVMALFTRGCLLFGAGTFMNFMKFNVPILAGTMPETFINAYGWNSPVSAAQHVYLISTGDILQLAGASLFIMAIFQRWLTNVTFLAGLTLVITVLSRELSGVSIPYLTYVGEILFGGNYHVYFPVFPWMSFILAGLIIGQLIRDRGDHVTLFNRCLSIGVVAAVIGIGLMVFNFKYHFGNFFHLGPGGVVYMMGFSLIVLWVVHKQVENIQLPRLYAATLYLSKRVTSVYLIQWILICWGMGVVGYQTLNLWQTLAVMPVVLALTFATQYGLDLIMARVRKPKSTNNTGDKNTNSAELEAS